ncbi:hypothetical protein SH501x_002048 [Pirellulaceae bacterium SH501]
MKCIISCVIFTVVISIQSPEGQSTAEIQFATEGQKAPAAPVAPTPPMLEDPSETASSGMDKKTGIATSPKDSNLRVEATVVVDSTASMKSSVQQLDKPLLPADAPDWVRAPQENKGELRFAIPTATAEDLSRCYEEFDSQLLPEVQKMLDAHVLRQTSASQLAPLTKKYIEDHWLVQDCEYDQVVELPSGTYHQLWKQVYISKEQLEIVRKWEEKSILGERIVKVGALGGASIGGMMLLSGLIGVLARRESRKLKA